MHEFEQDNTYRLHSISKVYNVANNNLTYR